MHTRAPARQRPGYYVNGRHYFGLDRRAQALAKAKFLAVEYGREVDVERVDYEDIEQYEAA